MVDVKTVFGALGNYQKGGVEVIKDPRITSFNSSSGGDVETLWRVAVAKISNT